MVKDSLTKSNCDYKVNGQKCLTRTVCTERERVKELMSSRVSQIHVVPNFHHDVAYLKSYSEYLPDCFRIIDVAIDILGKHQEYRFLVEQVILLQEYWNRFEDKRQLLSKYAREGRLEVSPGFYVTPDMNIPGGESFFMQIKLGKNWLKDTLAVEPRVCWIADCWGHHAQLPQILGQCGYEYYAFLRSMRRDVMKHDFVWEGLDGSTICVHWLAKGYSGIFFPDSHKVENVLDLNLFRCDKQHIEFLCDEFEKYGPTESIMLCNGGDMMYPQPSAPLVLKELNSEPGLAPLRFSTPVEFMESINWSQKPVYSGEFNSAFQGTFTSNIRIKQLVRRLSDRLIAIEKLSVIASERPEHYDDIWQILLKQQSHDTISGTITDTALEEAYDDLARVENLLVNALDIDSKTESCRTVFFNPLSFERTEIIDCDGKRFKISLPALGFANPDSAEEIKPEGCPVIGCKFSNEYYKAVISDKGYITSLVENSSGSEIIKDSPAPFGSLGMQIDNGDLWLNFESPISGGSIESSLSQNNPDPYDRSKPGDIVDQRTFPAKIHKARVEFASPEELIVMQQGSLDFWRMHIPFKTQIRFLRNSPRIEYKTTVEPSGKHYRIRSAFPTNIQNGLIRHEIPFGIQDRPAGEHVAQNWADYCDNEKGLALLNRGIPANNVCDDIMLLTLFRSAAIEYKTQSTASFNENIRHVFDYAIMPHGTNRTLDIIKNAYSFNNPPLPYRINLALTDVPIYQVKPDNIIISAMRWSGSDIFLRIYESLGTAGKGHITVSEHICSYAWADGLEMSKGKFRTCSGKIPVELRGFEIRGLLLRK